MICVYPADCTDFSNNGLGSVNPTSCTVTETLNGEWELTLVHPIDERDKWRKLTDVSGEITIDSVLQEAYSGITSMNSCMSGDFPTLPPETSTISWTGNVTYLKVEPNWRYL